MLTFTGDAAAAGPLCRRHPGASNCRTRATTPTTTCSSGSARWTRKGRSRNVSDGYRAVRTPDSRHRAHRTRRGRAPLPRRVAHPGAGRRRLAPAVRPQPRHRRTTDQRAAAARRRRTPCTSATAASRLVLPAGAAAAVNRLSGAPARRSRQASASSCTGVRPVGSTGSGTQLLQPAYSGVRAQPHRLGQRTGLHHQHGQPVLGPEVQPVGAHRLGGPDVQRRDLVQRFGPVDLNGGNDFRARPQHELVLGAVGCRGVEQVAVFGPHPLGVAVGDGREQQELATQSTANRFS